MGAQCTCRMQGSQSSAGPRWHLHIIGPVQLDMVLGARAPDTHGSRLHACCCLVRSCVAVCNHTPMLDTLSAQLDLGRHRLPAPPCTI